MIVKAMNMKRIASSNKGFSLIEVLVSLVIFAIGVLGLVGMYFASLKAQSDAKNRSAITLSMSSMMDRITANPKGAFVASGGYKWAYGGAVPSAATCADYKNGVPFSGMTAFANSLTPIAQAALEAQAFRDEMGCSLPAGDVDITSDLAPTPDLPPCTAPLVTAPNMVTIRVRWTDSRSEAQTGSGGANTTDKFECYSLTKRIR
jgi:type IV pilus modification protein PilV